MIVWCVRSTTICLDRYHSKNLYKLLKAFYNQQELLMQVKQLLKYLTLFQDMTCHLSSGVTPNTWMKKPYLTEQLPLTSVKLSEGEFKSNIYHSSLFSCNIFQTINNVMMIKKLCQPAYSHKIYGKLMYLEIGVKYPE